MDIVCVLATTMIWRAGEGVIGDLACGCHTKKAPRKALVVCHGSHHRQARE